MELGCMAAACRELPLAREYGVFRVQFHPTWRLAERRGVVFILSEGVRGQKAQRQGQWKGEGWEGGILYLSKDGESALMERKVGSYVKKTELSSRFCVFSRIVKGWTQGN